MVVHKSCNIACRLSYDMLETELHAHIAYNFRVSLCSYPYDDDVACGKRLESPFSLLHLLLARSNQSCKVALPYIHPPTNHGFPRIAAYRLPICLFHLLLRISARPRQHSAVSHIQPECYQPHHCRQCALHHRRLLARTAFRRYRRLRFHVS